jgi:conjugal transfer mating pair stabilization protein TraN
MCQAPAQNVCGIGYTWDAGIDKCTRAVSCPENGIFNTVTDRCEKLALNNCPVGYVYDSNPVSPTYDRCVKPVVCTDGGVFVTGKDRCEKNWVPACDTVNGYSYNDQSAVCQRTPLCSYGSYNGSYNLCVQPIVPFCPSGYSYNTSRTRCEKAPECPAGTTYNVVSNKCDAIFNASQQQVLACSPTSFLCASYADPCCNVSISCPNGSQGQVNVTANYCCLGSDAITIQSPLSLLTRTELTSTGYALSALQCDSVGNCSYYFMDRYCYDGSPASAWMLSGSFTMASAQMVCPAGQALINGNQCLSATNPTCSGGNFDPNMDVCWTTYSPTCSQGTYDSATGLCIIATSCPNGTLNTVTDLCEAAITRDCGTYSLDMAANLCYSPPVCANGAYDADLNICQATLTRDCGSYSWSQGDFKCLQGISCPQDPAFSLATTTTYSSNLDICVSATQHDCPAGTTYTPLPIGKCEAVPICSNAGIYNLQKDGCFEGFNTCPLGTQYACMEYQGKKQCSPNSCFDPGAPGEEITTILDESMLKDDGPRNSSGQCLGQIYIFNGKASRCRPPGLKVGMLNDCCESDQVASEDTGSSIQSAIQGIQMAYEIGQVAYYGNALVTGAAQISAISTSATGAVTSMTVVTATGTTTTLSGAAATGAYATMASGATGVSALGAGLQAYALALFNPTTIIIAVVIMVVMKVLMGSGCDQGDIQTGMQNAAKDCHYVGDYCEKKWSMVGCIQKAKSYCCFNSKIARIIHEQGRPQLLAFQPNGAWGAPEKPNCRGFTPEEFQALDFSRIDLSEYFEDVQKDLSTKIQGSQQTIMQNIQNKYQATPK